MFRSPKRTDRFRTHAEANGKSYRTEPLSQPWRRARGQWLVRWEVPRPTESERVPLKVTVIPAETSDTSPKELFRAVGRRNPDSKDRIISDLPKMCSYMTVAWGKSSDLVVGLPEVEGRDEPERHNSCLPTLGF